MDTTASLATLRRIHARDALPSVGQLMAWLNTNSAQLNMELWINLDFNDAPVAGRQVFLLKRDGLTSEDVLVCLQIDPPTADDLGALIFERKANPDASKVVWVAPEFSAATRTVIQNLGDGFVDRSFCVELRVVRIGESAPAIHFRVVHHPTSWDAPVRVEPLFRHIPEAPVEALFEVPAPRALIERRPTLRERMVELLEVEPGLQQAEIVRRLGADPSGVSKNCRRLRAVRPELFVPRTAD